MSEPGKGTPTGKEPEDVLSVFGEGLTAPSLVRLFGREFTGMTLGEFGANPTSNNPLLRQLQRVSNDPEEKDPKKKATLARIYGFTYLGNYYKLPEPTVFLVFGAATAVPSGFQVPEVAMGILGVEQKIFDFTEGVFMWAADELDITIRVDLETGWLKDLLLDPAMSGDGNQTGDARRADMVARANLVGNANLVQRARSR